MVLAVPLQNYSSELGIALGGARTPQVERERERIAAPVQLYISRLINFIAELIINFDAAINNECY
jgi:hypothetical protein